MAMSRRAPGQRTRTAAAPKYETHEHTRSKGKGLTYTISVDQWGGYSISLGDKLLRSAGSGWMSFYPYGLKRLRAEGLAAARAAIEDLSGMHEE